MTKLFRFGFWKYISLFPSSEWQTSSQGPSSCPQQTQSPSPGPAHLVLLIFLILQIHHGLLPWQGPSRDPPAVNGNNTPQIVGASSIYSMYTQQSTPGGKGHNNMGGGTLPRSHPRGEWHRCCPIRIKGLGAGVRPRTVKGPDLGSGSGSGPGPGPGPGPGIENYGPA